MTTLLEALRKVLQPSSAAGSSASPESFFDQGEMTSVGGDGRLFVTISGRTVEASPMSTDEVFKVGDRVWVSQAGSAYIVNGGAR